MTTTSPRTTPAQRVLLVAFGLALGAALAAGVWWILRSPPCEPVTEAMAATSAIKSYKEPCHTFGWTLSDPGYTPHIVRYNGFGMHDDPVTFEKPPNTYRILILGDSYAQGLQLPMEQGFPSLLEADLNDSAGNTRYEVVNFSIDTLGTDRLLMLYALIGYQFDADLVLLATYVGNDIQNNSIELAALRNEGYQPRPFFKRDAGGNLRLHNWRDALPEADAPAPAWLRRAHTEREYPIQTPAAPQVTVQDPYTLSYPVQLGLYLPEDDDWREAWDITEGVLAQFAQVTAAQGSDFALLVIPDRRAVHTADYQQTREDYPFLGTYDAAAPVQRMMTLAAQHDIPALDLLPVLQAVDQRGERAYLRVDGHYNETGHAVTAQALARWLRVSGWLPE